MQLLTRKRLGTTGALVGNLLTTVLEYWSASCRRETSGVGFNHFDAASGKHTTDLEEGCRVHSGRKLATLGRKIKPHYTWNDIVLLG